MTSAGMSRPRTRSTRSMPKPEVMAPLQPQRKRSSAAVAQYANELELEVKRLRSTLEQQKREFEEETASFPQVLARLAHSERALGQTKSKLIAAEEAATLAGTQLNALRARAQEAEAKLQQSVDAERQAQSELLTLRDALAAALEREPALRSVETELRSELSTLSAELEAAHQERDQLLQAFGSIQALAQGIARVSREPKSATVRAVASAALPPSQYPDAEDARVTMKPAPAPSQELPRSFRRATPDIIVDGLPLAR
jgi:chromosome segregation ATPase